MAIQYEPSLPELMDFFCEGEHRGFPEGGIQGAEARLGLSLPPVYRDFLLAYGLDPINFHFNQLQYPGELYTTYAILEDELRSRAPDFEKALRDGAEADCADDPYFRLWRLPRERWGEVTDNYLLIWYENQGVWSAGYRVRDLLDKQADPPVYLSVNDDYVTYQKWTDGTEDFLREMLLQASYGWHDGQRFTRPADILEVLSAAGLDAARFRGPGGRRFALDRGGETLYAYWESGDFQELFTAGRRRAARSQSSSEQRVLQVPVLVKNAYQPDTTGPYRLALHPWQIRDLGMDRPRPADCVPLHPLAARLMQDYFHHEPATAYDWDRDISRLKVLKIILPGFRTVYQFDGDTAYIYPPGEHFPPPPYFFDLRDWSVIGRMTALQTLVIDCVLVEDPSLWPSLAGLPRLRNLRVQNTRVGDFSFLRGCRALHCVSFYNTDFSDCRLLSELPRLQEADIRFCPLTHKEALEGLSIKVYGPKGE